jgi:hypothetical protein
MRIISSLILCLFAAISVDALPLKGFNTNAFLYNFYGQQFNQEYLDALNQLRPEVLRFPGGTIGNKYHFYGSGYGQQSNFDKRTQQNYAVEFVRLVKSLDHTPKVIFVINMFEHFHQPKQTDWELVVENLTALLYLQSEGVEIIGVELGNEFYLYPVIRGWDIKLPEKWTRQMKQQPDTDEWWPDNFKKYRRLALLYHTAIKKIDPKIKTGIPMGSSMNKNHVRWNFFAGRIDFQDAFIQHWYGQLNNAKTEDEARANFHQFTQRIANNITSLRSNTGKEIWITEWNAIDFGFKNDRNMHWKQTPLHVELNTAMQEMLDSLDVNISIYHRISSGKDGNSYNLINVDNGRLEFNPTFKPFTQTPFKSDSEPLKQKH